jgi:hypothetical protein
MADLGSGFENHRRKSPLERMRGCGEPHRACANDCDRLRLRFVHDIHPSRMIEQ